MRYTLRYSRRAARDMQEVLIHTRQEFGQHQYEEYQALIREALQEIATDPLGPHSRQRPELHPSARLFHLARPGRNARHFFVYRIAGDQVIHLSRLLHDAMDLRQHVPKAFRA